MGLLDFLESPQGNALASGLATYAATARRGQPINSLGRGALGAVTGYGNAMQGQRDAAKAAQDALFKTQQQEMTMFDYSTRRMAAEERAREFARKKTENKHEGNQALNFYSKAFPDRKFTVNYDDSGDYQIIPISGSVGVNEDGSYVKPMSESGIDAATGYSQTDNALPGGYVPKLPPSKPYNENIAKFYGFDESQMMGLRDVMEAMPDVAPSHLKDAFKANLKGRTEARDSIAKERAMAEAMGIPVKEYLNQKMNKSGVNVKVENLMPGQKEVMKDLAQPVGQRAEASLSMAEGAVETMHNANSVRTALNKGLVIAGPMAGVRMKWAQLKDLAGFGNPEELATTRSTIQGLAGLTLDSRASLKGQGQITEGETKLLERARSGNIEEMTVGELQQVVDISQRLAGRQWANHQQLIGVMKDDPAAQASLRYYMPRSEIPQAIRNETQSKKPENAQQPAPKSSSFDMLPNAGKYDGKTIRDEVSGKRYMSKGGRWVEVK